MSNNHPLAGQPAPRSLLVDVAALLAAYTDLQPDGHVVEQQVAFGTSGHRGSSLLRSFNEWHVWAITQAICDYRRGQGQDGPMFVGIDSHALSMPALNSTLEVLAANGIQTLIAAAGQFTPTPVISHAILVYNRQRQSRLADGIVISPSHNPPDSGGIKYNPTNGGPADTVITNWVQQRANELLNGRVQSVMRVSLAQAMSAASTLIHDFRTGYVADLANVIDFDAIRAANIHMAVDPMGGAGLYYWSVIAEQFKLDLTVINERLDPQFGFMTLDWDGKIRLDPSSPYAMQGLLAVRDRFDVAFACDTDHDRHGIVCRSVGLMPPNHYLAVAIDYLFAHRSQWHQRVAIGKTVVSTSMIDRVAQRLGRKLLEVPVGFKWFVDGLHDGTLGFGGEESAGATFLRRDGRPWTTDKDGICAALLSAEIMAVNGKDPGASYQQLCAEFGDMYADRVQAHAGAAQKRALSRLQPAQITQTELAGDPIELVLSQAPGNNAAIGGIKVRTRNGWFAARPSGTEDIYKIYAESFSSDAHLRLLLAQAQLVVDAAIAGAS